MPLATTGVPTPRDLHRRRLAGGVFHRLGRLLSVEPVVSDEQAPSDVRRRNSACALLELRNRRHHLNDDNPSSG